MQNTKNCVICAHNCYKNVCKLCGIYMHTNPALKTDRFASEFYSSHEKFLTHLKQRSCKILSYAKQLNQDTVSLLQAICEKFQFKLGTLALGIYYYQLIKQQTKSEQINQFVVTDGSQPFEISTCLIAAGKAIQLDKKVPYLDRYQRYADKTKTQQQYQTMQRLICQKLNFDMQFSTFVNFLNYYMTLGIVFTSDKIVQNKVHEIQDEIIYKAQEMVFKGRFVEYDPNELAIKIICETRMKFKLNPWCSELQIITSTKPQNKLLITPKKPIQQTLKFSNFYPNSKTKTQVKKLAPKIGNSNCKQNRQKSISGYSSVKNVVQKSTTILFDLEARLKSKNSMNQAQTERENLKVKRL